MTATAADQGARHSTNQNGTMTEVPTELFNKLVDTAFQRYGFTIEPRRSAALGPCALCSSLV